MTIPPDGHCDNGDDHHTLAAIATRTAELGIRGRLVKPSCPQTNTLSCRRQAHFGWMRCQTVSRFASSGIVCGQLTLSVVDVVD